MYYLGIDTTQKIGRICLSASDNDRGVIKELKSEKVSESLITEISDFLQENGISLKDIEGIGVNCGPGSFTGLRIGVSVAKGLAKSINCHCSYVPLTDCLQEVISINKDSVGLLLINLGKKGIVCREITNGKLSEVESIIQANNLEVKLNSNKNIYLYNLNQELSETITLSSLSTIACDNVISNLVKITKKKINREMQIIYQ